MNQLENALWIVQILELYWIPLSQHMGAVHEMNYCYVKY